VVELDDGLGLVNWSQYTIGVPNESIADLKEVAEFLIKVVDEKSITPDHIIRYRYEGLTDEQVRALPTMRLDPPNPSEVGQAREGPKRRRRREG